LPKSTAGVACAAQDAPPSFICGAHAQLRNVRMGIIVPVPVAKRIADDSGDPQCAIPPRRITRLR
jgi:hypothetical protein